MGSIKKGVSLCIIAMLGIMQIVPCAYAKTEIVMEQDFDSLADIGEWDEVQLLNPEDGAVTVVSDDTGKMLQFGVNTAMEKYGFYKDITPTNEEITISFKSMVGSSQRLDIIAADSNGKEDYLFRWNPNNKWAVGNDGTEYGMHWGEQLTIGVWYETVITMKPGGKTTTSVYALDGSTVVSAREGSANIAEVSRIIFRNNSSSTAPNYIDNIKIMVGEAGGDEPSPDGIYLYEDFENGVSGWNIKNIIAAFTETTDDTHNLSANIKKIDTAQTAEITKNLTSSVSEGAIKVSYSVKSNGNSVYTALKNGNINFVLSLIADNGDVYATGTQSTSSLVASITPTEWITIENIVNFDTRTNTVTVYDKNGNMLGTNMVEDVVDADKSIDKLNGATAINFRNWHSGDAYIDDVSVTGFSAAPTISNSSITLKDFSGNTVKGIWNVSPKIENVSLNFGTRMKESTLGGIRIEEGGGTIGYTGKLSATEYVMTLTDMLKENTSYTLIIPAEVENIGGETLGKDFKYSFETGSAENGFDLISLSCGIKSVLKLSDIKKGDKLTLKSGFGNTSDDMLPVSYIIAYYSGRKMVRMQSYNNSAEYGFGIKTQEISVEDITGVDRIKIFAWDSTYDMISYGKELTLEN